MNSKKILATQLAKFLRLNGDDIVNGTCKFSLTTYALSVLNALFNEILLSERYEGEVFHDSKSTIALFEDVQYLLTFVAKTPSLKILHSGQTLRGGVDLSRFINLKILELHKVPAHLVIGLEKLSSQLETVICNRSMCFLKEIFNCGLDPLKNVWIALTELNVSFNHIDGFDESFGVLPSITYIDASHNNLEHVDEIQMLEKLVFLNLSYNLLENIPILSGLSCYSLKVLFMRNNVLEDLDGVDVLINLEELDVSYNCLSEHTALRFLGKLASLKILHLQGNPLFFHKNHRLLTSCYLHPTAVNHLLLNGKFVSSDDMDISVKGKSSYTTPIVNFHQTSINVVVQEQNMHHHPRLRDTSSDHNTEIASINDEVEQKDLLSNSHLTSPLQISTVDKVYNKNMKIAPILDMENLENFDKEVLDGFVTEENEKNIPLHIQTKQLMEKRRKDLKEGWLVPTHSFETLGIYKPSFNVPPNTPVSNNLLTGTMQQIPEQNLPENLSDQNIQVEQRQQVLSDENGFLNRSTQILSVISDLSKESDDFIVLQEQALDAIPQQQGPNTVLGQKACNVISQQQKHGVVLEQQTQKPKGREELKEPSDLNYCADNLYQPYVCNASDDSDSHSDTHDDADAKVFIVRKIGKDQDSDIFIKIKKYFIQEVDAISGKIDESLDLRSLISVEVDEKVGDYILNLSFDSTKITRKKRQYIIDDKDIYNEILSICKPFADAKAIYDLTTGAFQCLKCSSVFSKQAAHLKVVKTKNLSTTTEQLKKLDFLREAEFCPNCGNDVIVEAELPHSSPPLMSLNLENIPFLPYKNTSQNSTYSKKLPLIQSGGQKEGSQHLLYKSVINDQDTEQMQCECNLETANVQNPFISSNVPQLSQKKLITGATQSRWESSVISKCDVCDHFNFISLLTKREHFSSETFTMIDHRLKLHLENKVFDDDEYLESCLEEVSVVIFPSYEEFNGLFAVSNKKVHILKKIHWDNDKLEETIKQCYVMSLSRLKVINVLLGNQGFSITCSPDNKIFLFLVRDADLCNSFILHLTEIQGKLLNFEPNFISLTNESLIQIETEIIRNYYPDVSNGEVQNEILLHLFAFCKITDQMDEIPVCIVITWKDVFLATIQFKKQNKSDSVTQLFQYVPFVKQQILNLTEVHLGGDLLKATIRFHDEDVNTSSLWEISTRTRSSLLSFLCEFKKPWEAIFGIELPLYFSNEFHGSF